MDKKVIKKIQNRVDELIKKFNGLKASVDEASEWSSLKDVIVNASSLVTFTTDIVLAVEISAKEVANEFGFVVSGNDKLKAAAKTIDSVLRLPWYLEIIDGFIIEIVLSFAVSVLNKYIGNDWDLDFAKEIFLYGGDFISLFKQKNI